MSSILIVEHEGRYIERIQDALSSEGWQPRFVAGRPEALRAAASEEPSLVLINAELPGAHELLRTFARRNGGPGSVALVAEHVGDDEAGQLEADEVLAKPFTDQDLRLVVRRGLSRARSRTGGPAAGDRDAGREPDKISLDAPLDDADMLTSADIFGDVLAEVEAEVDADVEAAAAVGAAAASTATVGAERPTPRPSRELDDPEIAERLEKTLSGVLGPRRPRTAAAGAAPAAEPTDAPRKRRTRTTDVNELLNLTLSSLEERPRKKPQRPAETPFADLDLSEIEALASGVRRRPRSEPPAAGPPAVAGDEDPGDSSWADVAREVAEPPPAGTVVAAPVEPTAGGDEGRFGHYTLLERIAVGGMAEVWKARMRGVEGFQKTVAIKKILPQMTDNAEFVTMFIDEAKLAAQLNHPNITHIYDLGKIGREHYIAMEFVDGPNLRSVLNQARTKGRPLPIGLALSIAARVASALDYAHRKRDFDGKQLELVHRDVSPQNVLLAFEGDIKLCDFGIVKAVTKASHTQMGALKGKLQYMSPEQAWGQPVDSRSDIFSLGSLLFEMLTGERLFAGDNEISVLDAVRECFIRSPRQLNPAVPAEADAVVSKALAKQPADRYGNAGEMQAELEELLYRLKPTPGQADLASYLRALDAADELDDEARAGFSWAAASNPPAALAAAEDEFELIVEEADYAAGGEVELLEIEGEPADAAWSLEEDAPAAAPAAGDAAAASVRPDDEFGAAVTRRVPVMEEPPQPPNPAARGAEDGAPAVDGIMAALAARGRQGAADEAGEGTRGDGTAGEGTATGRRAAFASVAPTAKKVEIEEGGRRGRWLLIAAILLVVALGLAAWYSFGRGRGAGSEPAGEPTGAPPPVATDVVPAASEGAGGDAEPAAGEGAARPEDAAGPAAATGGETAGDGDAASGVAYEDLQGIVEQEMAKREGEIRREQDARVRNLEQQLREAQAEAARALQEAAIDEGDGGDGGP